jgi:dephospho-CoA kinase
MIEKNNLLIIGITGSVASGKNFVADIFYNHNFVIFDADSEVHKLLTNPNIVKKVTNLFGKKILKKSDAQNTDNNLSIDRQILGQMVFGDDNKLFQLETIIYKELKIIYQDFLQKQIANNQKFIALNIPLLLEKSNYKCDKIIGTICSYKVQKKRFITRELKKLAITKNAKQSKIIKNSKLQDKVMQREILSNKFDIIIRRQFDNRIRIKYCDFIIRTDISRKETINRTTDIINKIKQEFYSKQPVNI